MHIPEKVRSGEKWASLPDKINAIIDCLRQMQPVAGCGIRILHTPSGIVIEALPQEGTAEGGEDVEEEEDTWDI